MISILPRTSSGSKRQFTFQLKNGVACPTSSINLRMNKLIEGHPKILHEPRKVVHDTSFYSANIKHDSIWMRCVNQNTFGIVAWYQDKNHLTEMVCKAQHNCKLSGPFLRRDMAQLYSAIDKCDH